MAGFKIRPSNYKVEDWGAVTMLLTPTHLQVKISVSDFLIGIQDTESFKLIRLYRQFPI